MATSAPASRSLLRQVAHDGIGVHGFDVAALDPEKVAEQDRCFGCRRLGHDGSQSPDRSIDVTAGRGQTCLAGGQAGDRRCQFAGIGEPGGGIIEITLVERELAPEDGHGGEVVMAPGPGGLREGECLLRAGDVPVELAKVRDARVGGERRP